MAATDVETASVFSDTASDFSELSKASTLQTVSSAPRTTTAPSSHAFTCLACHVAFRTADNQRDHMRSDWHRYNLKRKVADIPPVSAENFAQRVQQQQQKAVEDAKPAFTGECVACRKTYSNENGYANHLGSKKHKEIQQRYDERVAKGLDPSTAVAPSSGKKPAPVVSSASNTIAVAEAADSASSSSTAPQPTPNNWRQQLAEATSKEEVVAIMEAKAKATQRLTELDCLFCSQQCQTFENNLAHMARAHSFFIPDMEYLVDIKGLIKFLGEKIAVAHVCIFCNGKGRAMHSLEACRKHMLDKGHCKILYEDGAELEIADFYDFSSTYPDEVISEGDLEEVEGEDGEDWEDVESELGDLSKAAGAVHITDDETQLVLPSGMRIGNRQYNRFWKQSYRPAEDSRDSVVINQLMGQYRQLGYQSTPYAVAVAHHERRMQVKAELVATHDFKSRTGFKHNKLQKHFRSQIGFGV
ncbi:hypothetical protein HDU89_008070 [Geranomyces variabilis]|nr:hypothetical protein HDU89_008070 [Geranomyces variabilis]